jgi:putative redox protein
LNRSDLIAGFTADARARNRAPEYAAIRYSPAVLFGGALEIPRVGRRRPRTPGAGICGYSTRPRGVVWRRARNLLVWRRVRNLLVWAGLGGGTHPTDYDARVKKRSATLVHQGGMRFAAETGTGRRLMFGDDTEANELSPVETLAVALGACSAMDVISILEKKRQVIDSYTIDVRAEQRDEYPQVFTRIDLTHIVDGTVVLATAVRRAVELSAAKYCPVNAMVSAGATEVHHHFRMRCTGAEPKEASGEVIVTGPDRRPDIVA